MTKSQERGFWRYFFLTFKESKYLLLKYCVSAGLYIVTTVLANLFDTVSLTYLNAFMSVNFFANVLGFGVSAGINVLINQNIKNQKKVQTYATVGFLWTVVLSLFAVVFLVSFPNFIMENIMNLHVDDFSFYYIMCAYFFLVALSNYLTNILKYIKAFLLSMFADCIPIVVAILGYVVLYFSGNYVLNYLAFVYIFVGVLNVCIGIVFLLKNKILKINVFAFADLKVSWKQNLLILGNMVIEFIWQIGYFAVSIFLIRYNEAIFNTYTYLENVLDILNGVLFAFISLTNIRIIRALGRNDYDDAYKHAKYSLLASFVIWCFYAVVAAVFLYPIALGVNKSYFDIIFPVTGLYVLLNGIRFLNWCMTSYVLRAGGKNAVVFLYNIFYSIILIVFCFVSKFLPQNLLLVYGMLALPDLICLCIGFVYFRSRKWMSNINQNVLVEMEHVKLFIFDFDEILKYGLNWVEINNLMNDYFYEHFSYLPKSKIEEILASFGKKYGDKINMTQLEKVLVDVEGSAKSWQEYKEQMKIFEQERKSVSITKDDIENFRKFGAKLFLISGLKEKELKAFLETRGVDTSIFDGIVASNFKTQKQSKIQKIKHIMNKERIVPDEAFILGDSYAEDVLVAKSLKLNYFRFSTELKVENVFKEKAGG